MSMYQEVRAKYQRYMEAVDLYDRLPKEERTTQNEIIKARYEKYAAAKAQVTQERAEFQGRNLSSRG